jgi:hypothetical protein
MAASGAKRPFVASKLPELMTDEAPPQNESVSDCANESVQVAVDGVMRQPGVGSGDDADANPIRPALRRERRPLNGRPAAVAMDFPAISEMKGLGRSQPMLPHRLGCL